MSPTLRTFAASLAAAGAAALAMVSCTASTPSGGEGNAPLAVAAEAAAADAPAAAAAAADSDGAVFVEQAASADDAPTGAAPAGAAPVVDDASARAPATVPPADPPIEPVGKEDGPATQRAQERLLELGFWLEKTNGHYGVSTTQAVMAFQKYYGLATDGVLGPITAGAMSEVTERPAGRANAGDLVEIDKSKQLLFIVADGRTEWILNASTGSEIPFSEPDQNTPGRFEEGDSVTRPGLFRVNREREEGWWEGDLGEIYRPKYFDGGIAIHGAYQVPDYPASHGCVRVSIQAMDWIWSTGVVPKGTPVWVHGEIPGTADAGA
jgi:hypothetical protein